MRGGTLLAAAVLALAGVVGCGGDDPTTSDATAAGVTGYTGEPPADALDYHLAADEYCRRAESELDEAASRQFGDRQPSPEELTAFVSDHYLPIMRRQLAQIRTIPIPAGEEEEVNAIYDAFEVGLAEVEANPEDLLDGPPPGIVEASRLAAEYGFDDCGLDT